MSDEIATREGFILRHARAEDLAAVDSLTVAAYAPIQRSYVEMLGAECHDAVRHEPERTWERKTLQNRRLHERHPDWLWVLDRDGEVFGYVSFWLVPEQHYGHLDNNAVREDEAGRG